MEILSENLYDITAYIDHHKKKGKRKARYKRRRNNYLHQIKEKVK